jgi:hypothetical protein
MRPRLSKLDRKHPEAARDAMEDIKDFAGDRRPVRNEIKYVGANRDRALGESDRTGRHYDHDGKTATETQDEGMEASADHEAD